MRLNSCVSIALALGCAFAPSADAALPYALDAGFNGTGSAAVAFDVGGANIDVALGVFKASNGGYWVAGFASEPAGVNGSLGWAAAVAKLTPSGALDPAFSGDGRVTLSTVFTEIRDVTIDAQERLVFTGPVREQSPSTGTDFGALRVLPSGSVDLGYGFFGYVAADFAEFDSPESVAVWPNGVVAVAGSSGAVSNASAASVAVFGNNGIGQQLVNSFQGAQAPRASAAVGYVPARNAMVFSYTKEGPVPTASSAGLTSSRRNPATPLRLLSRRSMLPFWTAVRVARVAPRCVRSRRRRMANLRSSPTSAGHRSTVASTASFCACCRRAPTSTHRSMRASRATGVASPHVNRCASAMPHSMRRAGWSSPVCSPARPNPTPR